MIQKKWIGIDVCEEKLDVFIMPGNEHYEYKYDLESLNVLVKLIDSFADSLTVFEATGGLEERLSRSLSDAGVKFCILNPRSVRNFARAQGTLAKTDKIDAKVLAGYAEKLKPDARPIVNEDTMELKKLCHRRSQLQAMVASEKNRKHRADKEIAAYIDKHIAYMKRQLGNICKKIEGKINANEEMKNKSEIIKSVPGVSDNTAFALISDLSELGKLSRQEVSSLAGVAPFNRDSGVMRGKRSIYGGRFDVRRALYMAALAAIRHNEVIRRFYLRLREGGKAAKVAIVACMRKLLVILNTMVKNNTYWRHENGKATII